MIDKEYSEDNFIANQPEFHQILMSLDPKQWCYQIERASRLHYQGWFKLKEKKRLTPLAKELQGLGLTGVHLSVESMGGNFSYCMKEDTRVDGPWMDKEKKKEAQKEKRADKYQREEEKWEELRPFQIQIRDMIREPIHKRHIHWVCDEAGNAGKTAFLVNLIQTEEDCTYHGYGRASDILSQVVKEGPYRTYLFNLTRSKQSDLGVQDLYQALESIKDGAVRAQKFDGGLMLFKIPHVFVMSNSMPDLKLLSMDRWRLWRIRPDYSMIHVPTYEHVVQ